MAIKDGQELRYWIVVKHEDENEQLLLDKPLRIPIFSTSTKASEFISALRQVKDKSLRVEVWISERKWPSRKLQYVENPKGAAFDPQPSECKRAIFIKKGYKTIRLAA